MISPVSFSISPRNVKLDRLVPSHVAEVLNHMARKGLSEQSRLHAFNLLRKMMGDAVELFQLLPRNPVKRSLKPKVPRKEARHLDLDQTRKLLSYVRDKEYGLAIWIQLYLGLRVGELQALTWDDLDIEKGICRIHRSYVRREGRMKDYPKGRRQHSHRIPMELLAFLRKARNNLPQGRWNLAQGKFVVTDTRREMLSYEWYHRTLKRYCKELGLPVLGTHSLRHSTSELYLHHGATPYDLQALFAHSSLDVTERYVHNRGRSLDRVCNVIQLFEEPEPECSQNVPK